MDDPDELLMLYDGPTKILASRDVAGIASYMKSEQCRRIAVLLGAGASAGSGVPDFRYPKKGLYSTFMARLNLPYPRALFELTYFRFNPIPLYTLAREIYPGRYRPSLSHTFVRLLADKGSLQTCFTENIDALERQAGVPVDRLVEAHGSVAGQSCVQCRADFDSEKMREAVERGEVARCESCGGIVKPGVVFHGDPPPQAFSDKAPELENVDLLFVIGTSLIAQPFSSLAALVPQNCPRVLIHMDFAGDIGMRSDDVLLLGKCDEVVRDLCRELGWEDMLEREWAQTEVKAPSIESTQVDGKSGRDHITMASSTVLDGSPPGEATRLSGTSEFGDMTDAEWQDKEPKTDSLTERLRTALEQSEKPSPHGSDPGITFVARSLSGEELFADTSIGDYSSRQVDTSISDGDNSLAVSERS
ncbi:DHS-like NAD/FAD-binding domain-containing protein [Cubamyces sp. BRFM 1775]|nr:DHS-like NAD/FAD-binding domain-containing protein [Cubamyces sp. BRFM 1775]